MEQTIQQEITEYIVPMKSKKKPKLKIVEKPAENTNSHMVKVKNKGTGAGGANTNTNGLPYEELTDLNTNYKIISEEKNSKSIRFTLNTEREFIMTKQSGLFKCMDKHVNKSVEKAHGCKNPDECYIDPNLKIIFILEKKFQQTSGSVCEKIQTVDMKIWQYNRTFPDYKIVYIYCLSEWFKENCKAEIEYLEYKEIPLFWGNSETYKVDIINFIINYK